MDVRRNEQELSSRIHDHQPDQRMTDPYPDEPVQGCGNSSGVGALLCINPIAYWFKGADTAFESAFGAKLTDMMRRHGDNELQCCL